MAVLMGLDIGQKREPSALCVLETQDRRNGERWQRHYLARFLERLPLGTPYPGVAERVAEVVHSTQEQTGQLPELSVDATGIGPPIIELLREHTGLAPAAVYFTHGDRRKEIWQDGGPQITLGKGCLVSRLQTLLQTRRLHLPTSPEAESLKAELRDYEVRVTEDANDRYGAFTVGTHDELVTALGLALQGDGLAPRVWCADSEVVSYTDDSPAWLEREGRRDSLPSLAALGCGTTSVCYLQALIDWDHGLPTDDSAPRLWVDIAQSHDRIDPSQLAEHLRQARKQHGGRHSVYAVPGVEGLAESLSQDDCYLEEIPEHIRESLLPEQILQQVGSHLRAGLIRVHKHEAGRLCQAIELGERNLEPQPMERPANAWRQGAHGAFGEAICWLQRLAYWHRPPKKSEPSNFSGPIIETGFFGPAARW